MAARPRTVVALPGGLTNHNLRVTTPDGDFVVRHSDGSGDLLAIDRDSEHLNSLAAAEAGVGAPVVEYRPDEHVLVIGYLDGRTYTNDDVATPEGIAKVADACRRLHGGRRFVNDFDMSAVQRRYLGVVRERGFALPVGYEELMPQIQEIGRALAARAEGTVPCHNDLLAANMVDVGDRLWLIDYEYAGNNDPCFELGNLASECGLDLDQLAELVTAYYGRPLRHTLARARLQGVVARYGWTLWGVIQHATSPLDFDFWAWAMERYDAVRPELAGPDLRRLLDDVSRTD